MPAKIPRQDLLDELHRLANELGNTPTREEMNKHGKYSRGPYDTEFGGWNEALRAAGMQINKPVNLDREEMIKILQDVAEDLGKSPTMQELTKHSDYSVRAFKREFGTWNDALRAAGLEVNKKHGVEYPTLECEWCGEEFQVKPALKDTARFCSWDCVNKWKQEKYSGGGNPHPHAGVRVELQCGWCGDTYKSELYDARNSRYCSNECKDAAKTEWTGEDSPVWKGGHVDYYGPNWDKYRKQRLEKDDYTCQKCGAEDELVVHHKTPFRNFVNQGRPRYDKAHQIENLLTVCRDCHAKIENPNR